MCLNVTTFCAELGATSRDETIARPGLLEHIVEGLHVVARDERAGENHLRSFQPRNGSGLSMAMQSASCLRVMSSCA